jgi:hypothetical protein
MPDSARRFANLLGEVAESLAAAPAAHPQVTLLAHSMRRSSCRPITI